MARILTGMNGRIPSGLLAVIDAKGHQLRPDAAASVARMRAAGLPAGNVTTAYRSLEQQRQLYNELGYPAAQMPGLSFHGEGIAVDWPEPMRTWVRANGAAYGWSFPIAAEPWHGEYDPERDRSDVPAAPPAVPDPTPQPTRRPEMRVIQNGNTYALVGSKYAYVIPNMDQVAVAVATWGTPQVFKTRFEFDLAFAMSLVGQTSR